MREWRCDQWNAIALPMLQSRELLQISCTFGRSLSWNTCTICLFGPGEDRSPWSCEAFWSLSMTSWECWQLTYTTSFDRHIDLFKNQKVCSFTNLKCSWCSRIYHTASIYNDRSSLTGFCHSHTAINRVFFYYRTFKVLIGNIQYNEMHGSMINVTTFHGIHWVIEVQKIIQLN